MMVLTYAGIGSRQTPPHVLAWMTLIAQALARAGWMLRSGGAQGADSAFELGAGTHKRIYLPWSDTTHINARTHVALGQCPTHIQQQAFHLAERFHPAWHYVKQAGRLLLARNTLQVLGDDLWSPVGFVLCWAKGVKRNKHGEICDVAGGTGLAVRLAHAAGIEVVHADDLMAVTMNDPLWGTDQFDIMPHIKHLLLPSKSNTHKVLLALHGTSFAAPQTTAIVAPQCQKESVAQSTLPYQGRWRRQ